jgi:hypothetical protein
MFFVAQLGLVSNYVVAYTQLETNFPGQST